MKNEPYGVSVTSSLADVAAPQLPYRPAAPKNPAVGIGLIGCGGITQSHLQAYKNGGYNVVALCSRTKEKAERRRAEFFPRATVTTDHMELLARADIAVVDIATHADVRPPLVAAALRAGKHVLSQKPFALDLETGRGLVNLAESLGRKLAVNQNGRWAPHFSWMREAIRAGLIGDVSTADFTVQWDHHWVLGTQFEDLQHLILYDFAIHWFDIATVFFGERRARTIYAAAARSTSQRTRPPFLTHACAEFDCGQATFAFNADCVHGQEDRTAVVGSGGTLRSAGPSLSDQRVTLATAEGTASPNLTGSWFPDGFQGAMAELLCAIEEEREPVNSARNNLRSLALCFAAVQSAERGEAITVASLPD